MSERPQYGYDEQGRPNGWAQEIADLRARLEKAERMYQNSQNTVSEVTRAFEDAERQLRHESEEGTACANCHSPAHAFQIPRLENELAQAEARAKRLEEIAVTLGEMVHELGHGTATFEECDAARCIEVRGLRSGNPPSRCVHGTTPPEACAYAGCHRKESPPSLTGDTNG